MLPDVRLLRDNCVLNACTAKAGTQVVVPYRDEDEKRHLKVMGDLGQIVPLVRLIIPHIPYHLLSFKPSMSFEILGHVIFLAPR